MRTTTTNEGYTNWHFTRAELRALLAHASTDTTRIGMCAIGLDVVKGAATATDGHRAAKVWGERVNYDSAVVPDRVLIVDRTAVEWAVKLAKRDDQVIMTTRRTDDPVTITVGIHISTHHLINASHPPVDQVIPQHEIKGHTGVAAGINAGYLADLALISDACPPIVREKARGKKEKIYDTLTLFPPKKELDPWLARISCKQNTTEWAVCIMPVRL